MAIRINRAIELLSVGQAIYYDGPHSGHPWSLPARNATASSKRWTRRWGRWI